MKQITLMSEQVQNFIKSGSMIHDCQGSDYYYMPFWFRTTEHKDVFEILSFDELPKELIHRLNIERNDIK